jgi:hypothetical protein
LQTGEKQRWISFPFAFLSPSFSQRFPDCPSIRRTFSPVDAKVGFPGTSECTLPIEPALLERMKKLGEGKWVFCSRAGTPINPGNALRRYLQPAAKELGIFLGGWHDFRHTLTTTMRRAGVHRK